MQQCFQTFIFSSFCSGFSLIFICLTQHSISRKKELFANLDTKWPAVPSFSGKVNRDKKNWPFFVPLLCRHVCCLGRCSKWTISFGCKKNCSFLEILQNIRSDKWSWGRLKLRSNLCATTDHTLDPRIVAVVDRWSLFGGSFYDQKPLKRTQK